MLIYMLQKYFETIRDSRQAGKVKHKTIQGIRDESDHVIHMVSTWANRNQMVLGQVQTDEKSNEITAIPELLELLEIKGCIVTIDTMGCQKEIAKNIIKPMPTMCSR